jgi:hypothetical protein
MVNPKYIEPTPLTEIAYEYNEFSAEYVVLIGYKTLFIIIPGVPPVWLCRDII